MIMLKRFATVMLAVLLCIPTVARADDDARQAIQTLCDRLLLVMKDSKQLGYQGRYDKLAEVVPQVYDMPATTKATMGVSFGKLSADESKQLVDLFTRFSIASYADQFDGWDGESFEIADARPSSEGAEIVPTRIVPKNGQATEIDYLMRPSADGHWRIVDVLLDGTISQTAVRRSEFTSIYRRDGFSGLTDMLTKKIDAMGKK